MFNFSEYNLYYMYYSGPEYYADYFTADVVSPQHEADKPGRKEKD